MLDVDFRFERKDTFETEVILTPYRNDVDVTLSIYSSDSGSFGLHFQSAEQAKRWLASVNKAMKEEFFEAGISPFVAVEEESYVTLNHR